jgi:hypothetical protein
MPEAAPFAMERERAAFVCFLQQAHPFSKR